MSDSYHFVEYQNRSMAREILNKQCREARRNQVSAPQKAGPATVASKRATAPRKRKKADDDESTPAPEKRLKRYRDHPPQNVMVKHERVMSQRMFLVERSGRKNAELHEDFSVLGSTGNVYVVNLNQIPTCTCPDFVKNKVHCKHVLFVLVKVLKLPDPLWYQAAFLTSELEEIFQKVEDSRHSVSDRVLQHFKSLKNGEAPAQEEATGRKPLEGDCPICFEDLSESSLEDTVYCKAMCGNNIHKECFNEWAKSKQRERVEVTCVYCRSKWEDGKEKGKGTEQVGDEGYMNLGKLAGMSSVRDTNTYHNWGYYSSERWQKRRRRW